MIKITRHIKQKKLPALNIYSNNPTSNQQQQQHQELSRLNNTANEMPINKTQQRYNLIIPNHQHKTSSINRSKQSSIEQLNIGNSHIQQQQDIDNNSGDQQTIKYYLQEIQSTIKNIQGFQQKIKQQKNKRLLLNQLLSNQQSQSKQQQEQNYQHTYIHNQHKQDQQQRYPSKNDKLQQQSSQSMSACSSEWITNQFKQIQNMMNKYSQCPQQQNPLLLNTANDNVNKKIKKSEQKYNNYTIQSSYQYKPKQIKTKIPFDKTQRKIKIFTNKKQQHQYTNPIISNIICQKLKQEDHRIIHNFYQQKQLQLERQKIEFKQCEKLCQQRERIQSKIRQFNAIKLKEKEKKIQNAGRDSITLQLQLDQTFNKSKNISSQTFHIVDPTELRHDFCRQLFARQTRKINNIIKKSKRESRHCNKLLLQLSSQIMQTKLMY